MQKTETLTTGMTKLNRLLGEERLGFMPGEVVSLKGNDENLEHFALSLMTEVALTNTLPEHRDLLVYTADTLEEVVSWMCEYLNLPTDKDSLTEAECRTMVSDELASHGWGLSVINVYDAHDVTSVRIDNDAAMLNLTPGCILINGLSGDDPSLIEWCRELREYMVDKGLVCFIGHDDSVSIAQEVDLELLFSEISTDDGVLMGVQRGKHRKSSLTPTDDLYFEYPMDRVKHRTVG